MALCSLGPKPSLFFGFCFLFVVFCFLCLFFFWVFVFSVFLEGLRVR